MGVLEYILFAILAMWLIVGSLAAVYLVIAIVVLAFKLAWAIFAIPAKLVRRLTRIIP